MAGIVKVYTLPRLVAPEELAGGTAVVIDVLRSSTTIVYALAAGAREIIPCLEVDEARVMVQQMPPDEALLCGERHGVPPEGFHLGNSPQQYSPERVRGKNIVLTTTNGIGAMARTRHARRVLIGAFVNARAVCEQLSGQGPIHLLCAGTEGQISEDDVLLAGFIVQQLQQQSGTGCRLNAQAITAQQSWQQGVALPQQPAAGPSALDRLVQQLRNSLGGRHLVALGLEDDIVAAAQIDRFDCVPELDTRSFRIR